MADIVIVDYGMANLRSVQKAFEAVECPAEITSDPDRVACRPSTGCCSANTWIVPWCATTFLACIAARRAAAP